MPLISVDKRNKFNIHPKGLDLLNSDLCEEGFAVLSLVGPYRTGKSFLLNLLAGKIPAFDVESTTDACTQGIWIYSKFLLFSIFILTEGKMKGEDGSEKTVFFMDTEGLAGTGKSANFDIQLFTLSLLLSSFLIFNSTNSIDESAISNLSYLLNCLFY